MEVPHSIYQSVHRSRQEQNINNNTSRLPSFRHLLLTLGNVDKLDSPHVSFNVSPDLTPHLIEDCSNRSSSEDTTWDLHRLHSPKQVYKLTSPLALSKPAQCAVEIAKQNTHGSDRPYRIVKDSRHRTTFPVPRGTTPKTQNLRPILKNAHQCRDSSHRAAGAGHISSSGATAHGKSKAPEKSHVAWQHNDSNMHGSLSDDCNRQIPRYTISPTPDRAWSQDSLRNDSTMVCSASNMREHFYGTTSSPTITTVKDTSPVTLHHGSQQKARVNLFRPSHHVNLLLNEQQHDVNLTFEVNAPFDRDADPAMIAPRLTRHYLDMFFNHQKHTPFPIYDMLPRDEFIKWAVKCQTYRSLPDRLMLYALMSYATCLDRSHAAGTSSLSDQAMFKAIVYREIETLKSQSPPSLQTVHMLLFLTLAEYGNHRYQAGADMFVVCVDVLTTVLKCDIEERLNLKEPERIKPTVYDFSATMEAECRRCTFWTVFTFGTHMGLGTSSLQSINRVGGVTVELLRKKHHQSCEWLLQQPRSEPDTAMLGMSMTSREPPVNMPSDMTHDHMIEMTRICADVNTHISRSRPMRLSSRSCLDHEQRRQHLHAKLRTWADTYNDALVSRDCQGFHDLGGMSRAVGRSHIRAERTGGLHMLYYRCQMQLSRRVHHQHLSDIEVSSQARHATVHAIAILRLAEETMSPRGSSMRDYHFVTRSFSSACAVLEAIDVVTAVGRVADILEPRSRIMSLLYSGLDLLAHLGSPWGHEFVRYDAVKRRVQTVFRFAEAALGAQKPFFCCSDPMVETSNQLGQGFDIDFDLTYGTDRNRYIRLAFPDGGGGSSKDDQDILIINTSSNNIGLS